MSNIYITEPPTYGKVVLNTSLGDIDIELWPKEAPLAVRNFVQLCLEGYYDNTIFHRLIKNMMIQGGDPTGTGAGGESVYGGCFKDEFHQRLKFTHRGIVAMANSNIVNTNTSQFFISLDKTEWLQGKHTIFGKVTGNTIFNVLRANNVSCDANDKPVENIVLKSIEVLQLPFDDIVPRARVSKLSDEAAAATERKSQRVAKKDLKLLSFGDEEEEEEEAVQELAKKLKSKSKSAHDAGNSEMLSSVIAEDVINTVRSIGDVKSSVVIRRGDGDTAKASGKEFSGGGGGGSASDFAAAMKAKLKKKFGSHEDGDASSKDRFEGDSPDGGGGRVVAREVETDSDRREREDMERRSEEKAKLKMAKEAYKQNRAEVLKNAANAEGVTLVDKSAAAKSIADSDLLTPIQAMRAQFVQKKRKRQDREEDTMSKLEKFSSMLKKGGGGKKEGSDGEGGGAETTAIEDAARVAGEADGVVEDDKDWWQTSLKFKKHIDDSYRYNPDSYETIDPLENKRQDKQSYGDKYKEKDRW